MRAAVISAALFAATNADARCFATSCSGSGTGWLFVLIVLALAIIATKGW